jgi:UDP-GlcNAc:undecaprenyl-phosphate GlcNAc-1-phosphate transferase
VTVRLAFATAAAALICFSLSPLVANLALRLGAVSRPSRDRWRHAPTPVLGGVAIAAGTAAAGLFFGEGGRSLFVVGAAALGVFLLGLVDDKFTLTPTTKLVGSLLAGGILVYLLSRSATHALPAPLVVLAVIWYAGLVHAFNLLDNIDGLAAGVGAIVALGMAFVLIQSGAQAPVVLLFALAGALLGFLPWNSHPARVFMGDGGSLFVGATLAGCALVPLFGAGAANPLWPAAVVVTSIVPAGEALFVTALRWMSGRNPTQGGVDHTSHRLVAIGFSQRRSVAFLYGVALAAAVVAVWLARSSAAALPAVAVVLVGVGLGAIYLAAVPTYEGRDFTALQRVPYGTVLRSALARSHAAQVVLDVILITAAYYAAYRVRFDGEALDIFLPSFAASLPLVLVCKLAAHYASGIYRRSWMTFGVTDLAPVFRAIVVGTTASVLAVTYLYRFERFSRGVFVIDALLLLAFVIGTRLSFRVMAHAAVVQNSQAKRVLICGARERGQLLAREMLVNTAWSLRPVGFLDGSALPAGSILGVRIYHAVGELRALLTRLRVEELVLSGDALDPVQRQEAIRVCADMSVPVRELVFEIRAAHVDDSAASGE